MTANDAVNSAAGSGFELTEHALASLVKHGSRSPLERWLERPLRAVGELESRGALEADAAAELRAGFTAALELFDVLESEARAARSSATAARWPR